MSKYCLCCGSRLPQEYIDEDMCLCDHCVDEYEEDASLDIAFPISRRQSDEDESCVDWLS